MQKDLKRKIMRSAHAELQSARKAATQNQLRNLAYNARRSNVVSRQRDKLFQKAARALDIDTELIDKLQQRDAASMAKFSREQRRRVVTSAKARAKRQAKRISAFKRRAKSLKDFRGNPTGVLILARADDISSSGLFQSFFGNVNTAGTQQLVTQAGFFSNTADVDLSVNTGGGGFGAMTLFIDFLFSWQSSVDATISGSMVLQANGGWQLEIPPPGCSGQSEAAAECAAAMNVFNFSPTGGLEGVAQLPDQTILERSARGEGSYGYVFFDELTPFSDSLDFEMPQQVVLAGGMLVFVLSLGVTVVARNGGDAEIDLRTGPFRINVPFGLFGYEY